MDIGIMNNGHGDNFHEEMTTIPVVCYKGGVKNNLFEGKGELYHKSGSIKFKGTFHKGRIHGKACLEFDDKGNLVYQGGMRRGLKYGFGKWYSSNGK